jgi:hypothetical protein
MMRHDKSAKPIFYVDRNLLSILCCFLIITAMWLGVYLDNGSVILAESSVEKRIAVSLDGAIASQPTVMNDLKNRVKDDLSEKSKSTVSDSGFGDPVIAKPGSGTGITRHSFDDSAKQVEITGNAVNRQKKENVAKIQGKAVNSGHGAENAVESNRSTIRAKIN